MKNTTLEELRKENKLLKARIKMLSKMNHGQAATLGLYMVLGKIMAQEGPFKRYRKELIADLSAAIDKHLS